MRTRGLVSGQTTAQIGRRLARRARGASVVVVHVPILNFHRAREDPRAPGRMRADLTLEGDHPSVIGFQALAELVARAAPIRRLAFEQGPRG